MELSQLSILLDDEDVKNVYCTLLIYSIRFESIYVVDVVKGQVVLSKRVKILILVLRWVIYHLNITSDTASTIA